MGVCVWVKFTSTKEGAKALLDTGAGISLLPKRLYDVIAKSQDTELRQSDRKITDANSKAIECFGVAEIHLNIEGQTFKHDFYVCENAVTVLLGRQFMNDAKIQLEPAANKIKIRGKRVTAYDIKGTKIKNTVNLIETMTIKPGQERQVWARLKGKGRPNDMVCMMEPSRTLFARTGALAGRVCTKPVKGKCAVRILNASKNISHCTKTRLSECCSLSWKR